MRQHRPHLSHNSGASTAHASACAPHHACVPLPTHLQVELEWHLAKVNADLLVFAAARTTRRATRERHHQRLKLPVRRAAPAASAASRDRPQLPHLCRPTVGYSCLAATFLNAVRSFMPFLLQRTAGTVGQHKTRPVHGMSASRHARQTGALAGSCARAAVAPVPSPHQRSAAGSPRGLQAAVPARLAHVKKISCRPRCSPAPTVSPAPKRGP
jgi:hypothetical protein